MFLLSTRGIAFLGFLLKLCACLLLNCVRKTKNHALEYSTVRCALGMQRHCCDPFLHPLSSPFWFFTCHVAACLMTQDGGRGSLIHRHFFPFFMGSDQGVMRLSIQNQRSGCAYFLSLQNQVILLILLFFIFVFFCFFHVSLAWFLWNGQQSML